jgi:phosphoesterase RecJ-like protein
MREIIPFIQQNDDFLLLTHRHPDGDTLGSAAALCAGLRALGKTAHLWDNPEITGRYLPYTQRYIAPEGYRHAFAIAVDTADASLLGKGWTGAVDVRIDHHPNGAGYAGIEYTDPKAAACGEVVYALLTELGVDADREMAALLYIAIVTDTGCFRYSNTTAQTHEIVSRLLKTGIDAHKLNKEIFAKTHERMAVEAAVSAGIEYTAGGRVAVASLTLAQRGVATEDDLENLAGLPQSIKGVEVVLLLREARDGWRLSCRTSEPYAANKICAVLGGGGHSRAAGAEIKEICTVEAARARALEALWESHPELKC